MGRNGTWFEALEQRALLSTVFANGVDNDIVRDTSTGKEHLAYYDVSTHSLKYSSRASGGSWSAPTTIEAGDATHYPGKFVSISLDKSANHYPGVAYLDEAQAELKYSKFNGSAWSTPEVVDTNPQTGYYPSLVFNGNNVPFIAYYQKSGVMDLKLAIRNDNPWSLTTIDSTDDVGRYPSIAISAAGRWGISYENTTSHHFKYARQTTSTFTSHEVDSTTTAGGGYTSLAFDPDDDIPTFTYYDSGNTDLKFTRASTTTPSSANDWPTHSSMPGGGSYGMYSNLWYTSAGRAKVTYYHAANTGAIYYNEETTDTPGSWMSPALAIYNGGGSETEASAVTDADFTYTFVESGGLYVNDTKTGKYWTQAANGSFGGRAEHGAAVFTDPGDSVSKMWVAGGVRLLYGNPYYLQDVWKSSDGVNWNSVTTNAAFGQRGEATLTAFGNQLWVIGGTAGSGAITNDAGSSVVYNSTDGATWSAVSNNLSGLYGHATAVFIDPADGVSKMWVVGGRASSAQATVYKSSDGTTWTTATSSAGFGARYDHVLLPFNGKLWVIGGHDSDGAALQDAWWSSDGVNWTLATTTLDLPGSTSATGMVYDNKMWYISGSQAWFSFFGTRWSAATTNAAHGTRDGEAGVTFLDKIWVLGGKTYNPTNYQDDIWYSN